MLGEASEELAILKKLKTRRQPLIDRMDKTFGYFRGDKFTMPESEGKWDNVTSNRAQSEGWKMINILAGARRSIFNEAKKEDKEDRNKLSYNELLVNGLLFGAESKEGLPDEPWLQAQMAFYRVVRGWGAYRLMVMEDEDKNPYLDLAVWDSRNVNYIPGKKGLLKAYYTSFPLKEQADDEYGKSFSEDKDGCVTKVDVWACGKGMKTHEAVIIGNEYVKKELVKIGGQAIDYLPIRIQAGGAVPWVVKSDSVGSIESEENISSVGEDYLVNNRELLDVESRLLTYNLSAAGEEAGEATTLEWDSTKGDMPPEWKPGMRDPRGKKGVFIVDKGAGQGLGDLVPQARGDRVQIALVQVMDKLNTGGLNPIAFGQGGGGETAFGVDIRNHNTREHLAPFQLAMEQDFVWMAMEITKQFKHGSFKAEEVKGYDSKFKWFSEKIPEEKIDPNKVFKCKLIIDELRDRTTHSGMALQEYKGGLLPLREILDFHQLSDDPDASIEALAQEQVDKMLDTPLVKGFLAKVKDYAKSKDAVARFELEHAFKKLVQIEMQNQQQGQPPGADQRVGQTPQLAASSRRTTARTAQSSIPPEVQAAAQAQSMR